MGRADAPGAASGGWDVEAVSRATRDVLRLARAHTTGAESLAEQIVSALLVELGLSAATLSLAEERAGTTVLRPLAAGGNHAPLTKHIVPAGLESMAETAQVFAERRPHFEGSAHGGGPQRPGHAVARWRDGIATEAYCLLPLVVAGSGLGVLGLEWPGAELFDPHERLALEALADAVALALSVAPAAPGPPAAAPAAEAWSVPERPQAPSPAAPEPFAPVPALPDEPPPAAYEVDVTGVLLPEAASPTPGAVRLELRARGARGAWWDVVQFAPGAVSVAAIVSDPPRQPEDGSMRHAFRAYAAQGLPPAETARLCAGTLLRSGEPGRSALLAARIDAASRTLCFAAAGESSLTLTPSTGSAASQRSWRSAPVNGCSPVSAEERTVLLLPGDRVSIAVCLEAGDPPVRLIVDVPREEPGQPFEAASDAPVAAPGVEHGPSAEGTVTAVDARVTSSPRPQPLVVPPEAGAPFVE